MLQILENRPLAELTTIGLGGKARFLVPVRSTEEMIECIRFANQNNLRIFVLGGGSNIVFPDDGFEGVVMKIEIPGVHTLEFGDLVRLRVGAGVVWDEFVLYCIELGLTGIESLSGIPGSVGATPIQNVGAYGQEVASTIAEVHCLQRDTQEVRNFTGAECQFGYRTSRFKNSDRDALIVTAVTFEFRRFLKPIIRYEELARLVEGMPAGSVVESNPEALRRIRNAVLTLRRGKSMVVDLADPESRSVGSFFLNPVVSEEKYAHVLEVCERLGVGQAFPAFRTEAGIKLSAARLIELAGFQKGYEQAGVGISRNHSLALVNRGGTSQELLALASKVRIRIHEIFGVEMVIEPVIVR